MVPQPGTRLGPYEVLAAIGKGGMAVGLIRFGGRFSYAG